MSHDYFVRITRILRLGTRKGKGESQSSVVRFSGEYQPIAPQDRGTMLQGHSRFEGSAAVRSSSLPSEVTVWRSPMYFDGRRRRFPQVIRTK